MRGEEFVLQPSPAFKAELPPHARRRVGSINIRNSFRGITSACAEKRTTPNRKIWILGNYLRMRGEERGRHPIRHLRGGITSACAEKSMLSARFREYSRNYLRMRGEEPAPDDLPARTEELPPHARRRGVIPRIFAASCGITSACAEKRPPKSSNPPYARNYLRMRGEELKFTAPSAMDMELPPHARRRARAT